MKDACYQVHKAICDDVVCTWRYDGKPDEDGALAKARAIAHVTQSGHIVSLRSDIIDLHIETVRPRVRWEGGGAVK